MSNRTYSTKEYLLILPALSLMSAEAIPHSPGGDPTGSTKSKW